MARPTKSQFQQLAEVAQAMEDDLLSMSTNQEYGVDIQAELLALSRHARSIREKLPKIEQFANTVAAGYKFAVVGPDGKLRNATRDESLRLIMGYLPADAGNALDIYHNWTVVDGKWVERPKQNPDGSIVRRFD